MKNPTFPNPLNIDFVDLESYEIAAILFALLAAPPSEANDLQYNKCYFGLVADYLHGKIASNASWAHSRQNIKPFYLAIPAEVAERIAIKADKKIQGRLNAAHVGIHKIMEICYPEKLSKLNYQNSLNKIIENMDRFSGIKDLENFETRIWRPSIPVIHLAIALAIKTSDMERALNFRLEYDQFYEDKFYSEVLISEAARYAKDIERSNTNISKNELIDIQISRPD